jgi:hypothetical protein
MSQRRIFAPLAVAAFVSGLVGAAPALANGGDFFAELAELHAGRAEGEMGPTYFGFVRDSRGRAMPRATVSATIGSSGSSMSVQTDVLGHYRIEGFSSTIDPASIEISCSKPGFQQRTLDRRTQRSPNAPIEVICMLEPAQNQS